MILFGIISGLYLIFAVSVFSGLLLSNDPKHDQTVNIKFDVLIPFKNEAQNLSALLTSLTNQTFPASNYEIYLINDHSSDEGEEIIERFRKHHPNIHLIQNPGSGKKDALITAFKASINEIILMSDADTTVPENWLTSHSEQYNADADMLIGSVKMNPSKRSFWYLLQVLEYKSISSITNGMAALKLPVMCSAANLSFRRSAVTDINDALNMNYTSGDDMFLLHYFKRHKKTIKRNNSVVEIRTEQLKKLLRQRVRWSGKATGYSDFMTLITGLTVLLMNLSVVITAFMACIDSNHVGIFYDLVLVKFFADLLITIPVLKKDEYSLLWMTIPLSVIYPFYSIIISLTGILRRQDKSRW
ncbi:glycosyltransferase [Saccharicrinis sp. FJH62]|uniref:glycosyltransferase n=1 Tax=Saccharicrinis sp. FJH62 TaxID=3344657 RepID=UPI0035D4692D